MDISKAKKFVELTKGDRKILVTIYEGGQVSSCIEDEAKKSYCETCQADDEACQQWIEHLKEKGYEATEIELGELELEESLPRFLEEREGTDKIEPVHGTEVIEHADVGTVEAVLGSPGKLQPGESGGGSPETS